MSATKKNYVFNLLLTGFNILFPVISFPYAAKVLGAGITPLIISSAQVLMGVLTMQILSPLTLIIGLGYFWGFQILIPAGKEREMLIAVLLGITCNLVLNAIMIPLYRQNGAAIANVVSELVVTLAYMYFCFKVIDFKIDHQSLLFNLLATMPFVGIVVLGRYLMPNAYYLLGIASVLYVLMYFAIQFKAIKNSFVNELVTGLLKRK